MSNLVRACLKTNSGFLCRPFRPECFLGRYRGLTAPAEVLWALRARVRTAIAGTGSVDPEGIKEISRW